MKDWLTTIELADEVNLTAPTIRRAARAELARFASSTPGGQLRFRRSDLDAIRAAVDSNRGGSR